ncbi:MAG: hypothetical protein JEZ08_12405 [Clostridiales bacterium]|nr:hypothetical protein [Clostridiales bacterium]
MKKKWLIIFCIFLVGCNPDISGKWINPNGSTEIVFNDDSVEFFGVEGTYKFNGNKLVLYLGSKTIEYDYDLKDDRLILYLDDGKLILEKE